MNVFKPIMYVLYCVLILSVYDTKKTEHTVKVSQEIDTLSLGIAVTTRHLAKLVIPAFESKHPNIKIKSYIHETGNVVKDVMDSKTMLALTTRNLKIYEQDKSATIMGTPIAIDGLVLAVSKDLPIDNLTFQQIEDIWLGVYDNWKQLNGPDLPIKVIGRTKNYDPIQLFGDFLGLNSKLVEGGFLYNKNNTNKWSKITVEVTDSDDLALKKLMQTKGAITYFPLQVLNYFKSEGNPIKDVSFNDIKATYTTIATGEYFIHRRLNVVTNGKPKGAINLFTDYILSEEGQKLIEKAGFLKLK